MIKMTGAFVLAIIIIAYAISRTLDYARGPMIQVFWPVDGESATSSVITVKGRALRVNKLTLNGDPVSTDEQGDWSQAIIIFPGLNKLTLSADDQFGRNTKIRIDILGTDNI